MAFDVRRVTQPGKESYLILNVQEKYIVFLLSGVPTYVCIKCLSSKPSVMLQKKKKSFSHSCYSKRGAVDFNSQELMYVNDFWVSRNDFFSKSTQLRSCSFLVNILGDLYNCSH